MIHKLESEGKNGNQVRGREKRDRGYQKKRKEKKKELKKRGRRRKRRNNLHFPIEGDRACGSTIAI